MAKWDSSNRDDTFQSPENHFFWKSTGVVFRIGRYIPCSVQAAEPTSDYARTAASDFDSITTSRSYRYINLLHRVVRLRLSDSDKFLAVVTNCTHFAVTRVVKTNRSICDYLLTNKKVQRSIRKKIVGHHPVIR